MPSSDTTTTSFTITLFGPMQVRVQGQPLPPFRSRRALWLLALLTLRHNRPVQRDWLAGTLWPDLDQSQAFANLRPILSELRRALAVEERRLQSPDRHTLLLDLTGTEVDVLAFDAAIKRGKLSDLEQAVALYSGPLLEGCSEEWVFQERSVREQHCLQALQKLGDAALKDSDYGAAVGYYRQAVGIDPWQEAARRGWMEALSRSGDINAALQVYREFVTFLRDDPKAVPDEQTSMLYERLRAEARQQGSSTPVVVSTETAVPKVTGYLPHPLTDLVGREDERLEVAICLRRSRLVTLIGPGGIGKTRLAREVASEVVREYKDGVWLVALEALSQGSQVIQQIASVLGLREEQGQTPLQSVTDHLRNKRLLLVLDNCEHLLEASAQVVGHLLRECGQVRLLATSREALGITGETVWSVPSLAVPDIAHLPQPRATMLRVLMGYESVQLFVERAQAVQKSFALSVSNARSVAQACRHLEGIPLAIELAAARVKAMTVEQIASRLEDHLGLLTTGSRTAQSRQQTLRATLDWSYDLLSEAERSLLRRLSVFAGGWSLEAAEQVCGGEDVAEGQVLDLLTSLVDKSLVLFEEREGTGGRYRLLEMVRQYAAESLQASDEAEPVKRKHRDWYLALAEAAEPQLQGSGQANWLQQLETEHDNLRAALAWSLPPSGEAGLRFTGALQLFWSTRGHLAEGRAWCKTALEAKGAQERTAARAKALNGAGMLATIQGDYPAARAYHEESLAIKREIGDRQGIAGSLNNLGIIAEHLGDYASARSYFEEALVINQEMGNRIWEAINLGNLGSVVLGQGDYEAAKALCEESLAIKREIGDRQGIAASIAGLGDVAQAQGDYTDAQAYYEESLRIRRELGDRRGISNSIAGLGTVAQNRGEYSVARVHYEESLAIKREIGDRQGIANSLTGLGEVVQALGDSEAARTLLEESLRIRRELGDKVGVAHSLSCLGEVVQALGDSEAARTLLVESLALFRETGHSWIIHVLRLLGHVERDAGDYAQATTLYQESLRLHRERGDVWTIAGSLEDFAELAGRQEQWERTSRLIGAAETLAATLGRTLPVGYALDFERTVATARAALGTETFAVAWEEGRALTLEQAVAYALKQEESA